jgi:uncharacterized protein
MRALLLAALFFCTQTGAQNVLPVPELTARVIDQTATLTSDEVLALSNQLKKIEDERGAQVVVLMIASTQPEDIFSYSNRVANAWKIGRKDIGDGVLVVVAKQDRKLRIEIAKSLEGAIPDVLAGQIIIEVISPAFKQNQYAKGLSQGMDHIAARIVGEALPLPQLQNQDPGTDLFFGVIQVVFFAFFAVPVLGGLASAVFGRKLGVLIVGIGAGALGWFMTSSLFIAAGTGILAIMLTALANLKGVGIPSRHSSNWSSGHGAGGYSSGGFSSSGGGFSSGGGGSFGGGGASGDW